MAGPRKQKSEPAAKSSVLQIARESLAIGRKLADMPREEFLLDTLGRFEQIDHAADADGAYSAAAVARTQAKLVRAELDEWRALERARQPISLADHRAELVAAARALRQSATEAGSFIAAGKALETEARLIAAAEAIAAPAVTSYETRDDLVAALRTLPADVLREALAGLATQGAQ